MFGFGVNSVGNPVSHVVFLQSTFRDATSESGLADNASTRHRADGIEKLRTLTVPRGEIVPAVGVRVLKRRPGSEGHGVGLGELLVRQSCAVSHRCTRAHRCGVRRATNRSISRDALSEQLKRASDSSSATKKVPIKLLSSSPTFCAVNSPAGSNVAP